MTRTKTVARANVSGVSFVQKLKGISEYRLDANGLQILLVSDPRSAVAGVMVTYHVGSRNEAIGYTGATHLLEHLMFKGSKNFSKNRGGTIWDILENRGALINATTWTDRTNYYAVVPREFLPLAIQFEADRMRNAYLREEDRLSEMPVVRNEFERGENRPLEALDKQLWALAYQAHPYHHSTIGWRSDIERVPIKRLKQFYDEFYHPDNATVTVVGNFDVQETLGKIKKTFGAHRRAPAPAPAPYTEEPRQEGERRVVIRRADTINMVALAHKIPAATHPDIPALILLALILGDGGKTSRFYRALVDTARATDVEMSCYQFRDPSLMTAYIALTPGTAHADVEQVIEREYEKLRKDGVTTQELTVAKQSIRASIAARRDGPYAYLASLNEEIAVGDWKRFATLPEALAQVTARDVRNAAHTYLASDQRTVGYFIGTSV